MPAIELTENEIIVSLKPWEVMLSFQKSFRIPLSHVTGAKDDETCRGWNLGMRSPGTGIPGIISAGTYLKAGDIQFVFITRGTHPIVLELQHEKWQRLIIGVNYPRRLVVAINAAIENHANPAGLVQPAVYP